MIDEENLTTKKKGSEETASKTPTKKRKVGLKTASKTPTGLNFQQEEFCQAYVNSDRELFGNGTNAYLLVYGPEHEARYKKPMNWKVAAALASRLLTKVKVIERINFLLQEGGWNNENVDKQHLFLINQHADLKAKRAAIHDYNELRGRIQKKIDLTSGGKTLIDILSLIGQ